MKVLKLDFNTVFLQDRTSGSGNNYNDDNDIMLQ